MQTGSMHSGYRFALKAAGWAAVALGLLAIGFGSLWASQTLELFGRSAVGRALELLVPFLPIFLIMGGAYLLVRART
jgi:hypothetical protein